MKNSFYSETLPNKTAQLINKLQSDSNSFNFLNNFYLSGGTALSLQIGHRKSEDLDFFSQKGFNSELLQRQLSPIGKLRETELAAGTLNTFINDVKLQFLEYPYRLIKTTNNWNNIHLSSVEDIACTKLQTIGMRGSKKDFVDLYFLLNRFTLVELFKMVDRKYSGTDYSKTHILKSLIYFKDAEAQPMPRMHINVSWKQVKEKLKTTSKNFSFD